MIISQKSPKMSLRAERSNLTIKNQLKTLDCFVSSFLAMTDRFTFYDTLIYAYRKKSEHLYHSFCRVRSPCLRRRGHAQAGERTANGMIKGSRPTKDNNSWK
jgi:hypothetical protein